MSNKIYDNTKAKAEMSCATIEPEIVEEAKRRIIKEYNDKARRIIIEDVEKWKRNSEHFLKCHKATNYKRENNYKDVEFNKQIEIFEGMIIKCKDGDYWFDK